MLFLPNYSRQKLYQGYQLLWKRNYQIYCKWQWIDAQWFCCYWTRFCVAEWRIRIWGRQPRKIKSATESKSTEIHQLYAMSTIRATQLNKTCNESTFDSSMKTVKMKGKKGWIREYWRVIWGKVEHRKCKYLSTSWDDDKFRLREKRGRLRMLIAPIDGQVKMSLPDIVPHWKRLTSLIWMQCQRLNCEQYTTSAVTRR